MTKTAMVSVITLAYLLFTSKAIAGDPVPGVDVLLEQIPGGGVVDRKVTNKQGNNYFVNVQPGTYRFVFAKKTNGLEKDNDEIEGRADLGAIGDISEMQVDDARNTRPTDEGSAASKRVEPGPRNEQGKLKAAEFAVTRETPSIQAKTAVELAPCGMVTDVRSTAQRAIFEIDMKSIETGSVCAGLTVSQTGKIAFTVESQTAPLAAESLNSSRSNTSTVVDAAIVQDVTTLLDTEFKLDDWVSSECPNIPLANDDNDFSTSQDSEVGNPAPSFGVNHTFSRRIAVCHIRKSSQFPLLSAEIDSLTFKLQAHIPRGGMAVVPLIKQGDTYYWAIWKGFSGPSFQSRSQSFVESDFVQVYQDEATAKRPDFSSGADPIEFGFVTANQQGASDVISSREANIDNWSVKIAFSVQNQTAPLAAESLNSTRSNSSTVVDADEQQADSTRD